MATSTCVSRGRRGTWRHLPSFCVAGVVQVALGGALGRRWSLVTPQHFAWQAWHLATSIFVHVAGLALGGIYFCFAWQVCYRCTWWRAWLPLVAVGRRWSPCRGTFRGRHGTWRHLSSFHVVGVALDDIHLRFTWQAWHLATSTFVLRGRCATGCTWWHAWWPLVAVGRR